MTGKTPPQAAASLLRRLLTLIFKIWPERRNQRLRLAELDKTLLSDIGIEPADARRESRRPFWQGPALW